MSSETSKKLLSLSGRVIELTIPNIAANHPIAHQEAALATIGIAVPSKPDCGACRQG
jgi:hypothetical protein